MTRLHRSVFKKMWIPRFKYELVEWLGEKYPNNKYRFKRMNKRQLLAIYYSVRGIADGR